MALLSLSSPRAAGFLKGCAPAIPEAGRIPGIVQEIRRLPLNPIEGQDTLSRRGEGEGAGPGSGKEEASCPGPAPFLLFQEEPDPALLIKDKGLISRFQDAGLMGTPESPISLFRAWIGEEEKLRAEEMEKERKKDPQGPNHQKETMLPREGRHPGKEKDQPQKHKGQAQDKIRKDLQKAIHEDSFPPARESRHPPPR